MVGSALGRLRGSGGVGVDAGEELVEVVATEGPVEWFGDRVVAVLEGGEPVPDLVEVGEVVGCRQSGDDGAEGAAPAAVAGADGDPGASRRRPRACLAASEVSPSQALVLQAATGRSPEDGLRSNRGWSDGDWATAASTLTDRGLVDAGGRITAAGTELRQRIEEDTDRLAAPIVRAIGDDAAEELVSLLRPLATAVMDAGAVPAHNNMGVAWAPAG